MKETKWLTISQSIAILGSGLVFPFYILFIKDIGANFSEFGISYGLFTISAAFFHKIIGKGSDKFGRKPFLIFNCWGMAILFILFPAKTIQEAAFLITVGVVAMASKYVLAINNLSVLFLIF